MVAGRVGAPRRLAERATSCPGVDGVDEGVLDVASEVISGIRRGEVGAEALDPHRGRDALGAAAPAQLDALRVVLGDVQAAGRVRDVELLPTEDGELVTRVGGPVETVQA